MTSIEQAIDKVKDVLAAFCQNNRPEDYERLLGALATYVRERMPEHLRGQPQAGRPARRRRKKDE